MRNVINPLYNQVLDSGFDFHVAFNGVYQELSWGFADWGSLQTSVTCRIFPGLRPHWAQLEPPRRVTTVRGKLFKAFGTVKGSVVSNFSNIASGHFFVIFFKRNFLFLDIWMILKFTWIKSNFIDGWLTTEDIFSSPLKCFLVPVPNHQIDR